MILNTNLQAQQASNNLLASQTQLSKSMTRLSSGAKIIDPSDDAAGLAMATRLDSQLTRLGAAMSNVGNATSYLQTQDGFLQKVQKALDRMSELSVLAQDVTKTTPDLALYDQEFQTLKEYISDVATKNFNGVSLFNGTALTVTVDSDPTVTNGFTMNGIDLTALNISTNDLTTSSNAATALTSVKAAIEVLSTDRAQIGAYLSRLNNTIEQMRVSKENLTAANSRIQDTDVAEESTRLARYNILTQAGTAMLAQANAVPQQALRLLQG